MNKANNIKEFKDAMSLSQIPMFNTLYADKEGNIFYVYNALIPKRKDGFNWNGIVPGDRSDLIWKSYYDFSELPQITNPASGYLQNCNSSPYLATVGGDNPIKTLPKTCGVEEFQTNRAFRSHELFGKDTSISRDEFYEYKYDTYYSKKSAMYYALNRFLDEVDTDSPDLLKGIRLLKTWDLGNQKENTAAALAMLTFKLKFNINEYKYNYNEIFKQFKASISFLNKHYGKIDIPLGKFQRLRRGEVDLPLDGAPDVLRAIYSELDYDKNIATHGDCFFQIVEWDDSGNVSAESIHQYGSATRDSNSKHYSDQSHLFSNKDMKLSALDINNKGVDIIRSYKP